MRSICFKSFFIVSVLFFSFVLSAGITHDGYYFNDITEIISAQSMDYKAQDAQGLACSKWCLLYSNKKNVYCMRYSSVTGYWVEDKSMLTVYEDGNSIKWYKSDDEYGSININNENCLEGYELNHIGDVDYYNGKIYIPMDEYKNDHGVIVEMDEVTKRIDRIIKVPRNKTDTGMPWVAVNPLDGRMYLPCDDKKNICAYYISESDIDEASDNSLSCPSYIFMNDPEVFDLNIGSICQGASFSENGILAVSGCGEWEGIKYYHITDGRIQYLGESHLKNESSTYNTENEGNTFKNGYGCGGFNWDFFYLYYDNDLGNQNSDEIYLFGYSDYAHSDFDDDGVPDLDDNCPLDYNSEQFDFDNDKHGNACDSDADGDGILNEDDNTPYYYDVSNSVYIFCNDQDSDRVCDDSVRLSSSEISESDWAEMQGAKPLSHVLANLFFAEADNPVFNYIDNCEGHYNPFSYEESELMYGVSLNTSDEVNVGAFFHSVTKDVVIDSSTVISIYGYAGVNGYFWQPDRDFDGEGDACESATRYSEIWNTYSFIKKDTDSLVKNEYLKIDMKMYGQNEDTEDSKEQSLMYCNMPLTQVGENWGKDGRCTDTKNSGTYKNLSHKEKDYSFSHGSEPKPVEGGVDSWRELDWESNPACLSLNSSQQSTLFVRNPESIPGSDLTGIIGSICHGMRFPYANTIVGSSIYWDWRDDFKNDFGDLYDEELYPATLPEGNWINHFKYTLSVGVKGENDEYITNDQINADHFYNTERYARTARFEDREIGYYKWEPLLIPEQELMIYFWEEWMREIYLLEGIFVPERGGDIFDKWVGDWKGNIKTVPVFVDNYDKAIYEKDGFFYSLEEDDELNTITLKYNHIENSAGWKNAVTFSNPSVSLEPAGLALSTDSMFMLMRNEDTQELSMYVKGNAAPEPISGFPAGVTEATLIESEGTVYAALNISGYIEMFEMVQEQSGGYSAFQIPSSQSPSSRTLFNILSDETGIYIAGGGNTDGQTVEIKRDIWKFDSQSGWQIINNDIGKDIFKLFMRKEDDSLLLVSQTGLNGNNASYIAVDTTTGSITEEGYTAVEGPGLAAEDYICIASNDTDFWAGFQSGGHCDRFSAPQYAYKDAGTPVYNVAGFGSNLFAAYYSGIKIYDLADPENPAQTGSISLYGPVKDLEIVGDRLYAATGNGIDILKITAAGLTLEKHIATYGDTAVVKNWNGTVIAGDGQGLKKVDTTTQEIIQQVNTSGDVSTFTIVDGIIHLYDWAGLKRYNADTFDIVATDNSYRDNPHITSSDGNIFMSYNSNVYELTYNGTSPVYTQKTGASNETAYGYSYSGYAYFAQGSGIRISTMAEIEEAICGNGEIEPGELCDGNSVACTSLDSDYDSGTAYCNSTCDGYNEDNCEEDDGW